MGVVVKRVVAAVEMAAAMVVAVVTAETSRAARYLQKKKSILEKIFVDRIRSKVT